MEDPGKSHMDLRTQKPLQGASPAERIALILTILWFLGAAAFTLIYGLDGLLPNGGTALQFMITLMALFMPVLVFWLVAVLSKTSRVMQEETMRLDTAITAIRKEYVDQTKARASSDTDAAAVSQKLREISVSQRQTETVLATFSSTRTEQTPVGKTIKPPIPEPDPDQTDLPFEIDTEDSIETLEQSVFIRALNFPETAEDKEGFAALHRALKHRPTAQLIQAAQDMLTLLSHDGIYMDDLMPDIARPEIWRRFAQGERGRSMASLGGIRDRSALALTGGRMKQDPIFRDTAHHFLRHFDKMISEFVETATDAEITTLSDTRTARAFMLLGRVARTFD